MTRTGSLESQGVIDHHPCRMGPHAARVRIAQGERWRSGEGTGTGIRTEPCRSADDSPLMNTGGAFAALPLRGDATSRRELP